MFDSQHTTSITSDILITPRIIFTGRDTPKTQKIMKMELSRKT